MTLALDTDVLVHWAMRGAPFHAAARKLVESEVRRRRGMIGITPQVIREFLHVCTDGRRFEHPLTMADALDQARSLWFARDVSRIVPGPRVLARTLELLDKLALGRKRILDTALAATLETAGVKRLATFNGEDFKIFPFLQVLRP